MAARFQILAVEGELSNPHINELKPSLDDLNAEIITVADRETLVSSMNQSSPDLLILSDQVSDVDSFDICKQVKSKKKTRDTPIIVISQHDSVDSAVRLYEAGAQYYLGLQTDIQLLKAKIKVALNTTEKMKQLQSKVQMANSTAMDAMEDAAQIGYLVHFMDQSFEIENYEALANLFFAATNALGLSASVVLYTKTEAMFFSDDSEEKPLEEKLLVESHKKSAGSFQGNSSRFITYKNRIISNHRHCSILVRNASSEEKNLGRQRDLLGSLINALEIRTCGLAEEFNRRKRLQAGSGLVESTLSALETIEQKFKQHEKSTMVIMDNLMVNMNTAFSSLGLTENQEEYLLDMVNQSMTQLVALYTSGIEIERAFVQVNSNLTRFVTEDYS